MSRSIDGVRRCTALCYGGGPAGPGAGALGKRANLPGTGGTCRIGTRMSPRIGRRQLALGSRRFGSRLVTLLVVCRPGTINTVQRV